MTGKLIWLMGASGSGKDSLLTELRQREQTQLLVASLTRMPSRSSWSPSGANLVSLSLSFRFVKKIRQQLVELAAKAVETATGELKITSDLGRTRRTAEIIAEACGCSVIADARLRELDMGVLEKRHIDSP